MIWPLFFVFAFCSTLRCKSLTIELNFRIWIIFTAYLVGERARIYLSTNFQFFFFLFTLFILIASKNRNIHAQCIAVIYIHSGFRLILFVTRLQSERFTNSIFKMQTSGENRQNFNEMRECVTRKHTHTRTHYCQ